MSSKSRAIDWEVKILRIDGKNTGVLEQLAVSQNRMSVGELGCFVKALMAKHSNSSGEELLEHFVNNRKGGTPRRKTWDLKFHSDLDNNRVGYCCGEPPLYAVAWETISAEKAAALKVIFDQNKREKND